jgi:hypothetical protein
MSKKNNNHRKEKKNNPDSGNGPFGAPVEQDGNNENERSKEASTFEISIGWKLEAERRAWLAALNEDVSSDSDIMMDVV